MPRQTEPNADNAMGELLGRMLPRSGVRSENTRAIADRPGLRPDILITAPGRAPVVLEAEYLPANTVEPEARERLGLELAATGRPIEAAIALRYPEEVAEADDLRAALRTARLSYCVFTEGKAEPVRFPDSGWLEGSVEDLADMVRLVSVPQRAAKQATDMLQEGIERAAKVLDELDRTRSGITESIADALGMANVRQTRRMACAIIANALVFHERIAGIHSDISNLEQVCGIGVPNPQSRVLAAWDDILGVNYWAIFAIAKDIVVKLNAETATAVLRLLTHTAQSVNGAGVDNSHDLTGRIFQRLIADRKYLATFYTLPASAALLARLAVAKLRGMDWSSADAIGELRVADFACGTGALLSAVYEQMAARHERAGGDGAALHRVMMEEVLYGCDVMPSAVHITGSTLSGVQPNIGYDGSRLYTLAYGRQRDLGVKIGSLELLGSASAMALFNTSDPGRRASSIGEETASQVVADIPDTGFDLVIMNPPFTSNTKHLDAEDGVLNAAFAAFDASEADQEAMAGRLRQMAADSCYHGHAGLASAFAALGSNKLRPNGVLALVLPATATSGSSWAKFRQMIGAQFTDVTVASIAGTDADLSFSSDTAIGECLVVARNLAPKSDANGRGRFISFRRRPDGFGEAKEYARAILTSSDVRSLETGPYGGIPIYCGDGSAGEILDAPIASGENGWNVARILDASVAQAAHALAEGRLWPPGEASAVAIPIALLNQVGERGPDSQLLISPAHQGPFTRGPASNTATYPALWNHNARNETHMICAPDSQLIVRAGMEDRVAALWATASRTHVSRGFRFNSQPLAAAITEQRSAGGRGWPNVKFENSAFDLAFAVWANSTLGLLCYWWNSNRQVAGRGDITIRGVASLPVLDLRALTDAQLATAERIFDEFRVKELKPAYLADADEDRALLDRRVVCDLLGLDEATYVGVRRLAAKWCAEPSVRGGKRRPRGAGLVV